MCDEFMNMFHFDDFRFDGKENEIRNDRRGWSWDNLLGEFNYVVSSPLKINVSHFRVIAVELLMNNKIYRQLSSSIAHFYDTAIYFKAINNLSLLQRTTIIGSSRARAVESLPLWKLNGES